MTTITNIQPKPYTQFGVKHERTNTSGNWSADVEKNKSIRIYGTYTRHQTPEQFDRTFQIGDTIEIGSYNFVYTGEIEAISDKRIVYRQYKNDKHTATLNLYDFINKNWDLDLVKISERNSETMQYI
jgi:hypothetical protein